MAAVNNQFKGGKKLEVALKQIQERASNARSVSVGFMEDATYPDGTSVAMVAAIQNFGAPEAHIPPRPFFTNMVLKKSPGWGGSLGRILISTQYDAKKSLESMGEGISSQLQTSIQDTNSPELKPETIKAKGFDKPLIDTAHMKNSVTYEVDK